MKSEVKRADLKCPKCNAELLVIENKVFCQVCKNPDGSFKQVKPNGI